jgi:AcrR family transcriptional regulator
MTSLAGNSEHGLRALKRRETKRRITEAGIGLFLGRGYEATTLDDIAAAAGISRRTFFHYFKSKDDILISLQSDMGTMIADRIRQAPQGTLPMDAVRDAVIEVCSTIQPDEMLAIDRLMHASESMQARKQASYVEHERTLFMALCERWPEPGQEPTLQVVAMIAMGAIRLSTEAFNREAGARTLPALLRETFDRLDAAVHPGSSG